MAHFVWVRGLLVRVTVRSRQVTCDDFQPLKSFARPVSNYYLGSYEPGGVPSPLREAIPNRNRVAVDSAQEVGQVFSRRHGCAQRRSTLAQAKLGRSDALIEPAMGWAWISRTNGQAQGAGGAS